MLRLENIFKKFNGIEVLKGLSCEVREGDFVVVMGPNGTGKSTLFDIISGKTILDEGTVWLNGNDITHMPEQKRAFLVGRLFQNTYLGSCASLTLRENLSLATLKGRRAGLTRGIEAISEEVIEELLKPLNLRLEKVLDTPMMALS